MAASSNKLLMNLDFPVFVIKPIGPRHFVVGGGGGPSATGVRNGLDIIELDPENHEVGIKAKSVFKYDTEKFAVMNCASTVDGLKRVHLACGHDDKCSIYIIKQKIVTPSPNGTDGQLRKRKSGLTKADDFKNAKKITTFDVQLIETFTTDFHTQDAYQNCAAFTTETTQLVTGGADGHIRCWKYPELTKQWEKKVHEHEVDMIAIDPSAKLVCTTSAKDRKLMLWNAENGAEVAELKWAREPPVKYKHKACKFCMIDKDPAKTCMFSIEVPVVPKKGTPSYISQWNIKQHKPIYVHAIKIGAPSCMEISECGNYLALGTMDGDVAVYSTTSFKMVYSAKMAHKTFVTDLAFTPTGISAKAINRDKAFTLTSISIDNQVKLHQPTVSSWTKYKLMVYLLILLLMAITTFLLSGFFPEVSHIISERSD